MMRVRSLCGVALRGLALSGGIALIGGSAVSSGAQAQDFYKDKRISVIVGSAPGGGYDTFARVVSRYWPEHIPGKPIFVIQNMAGAGSLLAANHIYNVSVKDGTVIGAMNPGIATDPLLSPDNAKFDARAFQWIGSPLREIQTGLVWHTAPVQSLEDLKTKELLVAGSGGASEVFPTVSQKILGLKFKVIAGYPGTKEGGLAMERGEVQGIGGTTWASVKATYGQWLADNKIKVIVQYGLRKHPELPDVPMLMDLPMTPEQREALTFVLARQDLGRPYVTAPGVPADRVALLRKSFVETMKDPAFVKEAENRKLDLDPEPVTGEELQKLVANIYATPEPLVKKLREMGVR
jgi:tripartite-type tricarboxylate transporter receptor subunit TctC